MISMFSYLLREFFSKVTDCDLQQRLLTTLEKMNVSTSLS